MFGEDADLLQEAAGSRNQYGEWEAGAVTTTRIRVATSPMNPGLARDIVAGDVARLEGMRDFYTTLPAGRVVSGVRTDGPVSDGDRILYREVMYRVLGVEPWGHDYYVIHASRDDPQPPAYRHTADGNLPMGG